MLTLSTAELVELTGYHQPARQLEELLRLGFWRARRAPRTGVVILERAHYDAVCAGGDKTAPPARTAPQLRSVA